MKVIEFIKNSECFFNFVERIVKAESRMEVLEEAVEDVRDYLGADRCSLFIVDSEKTELVSWVAQGADEIRLPIDKHTLTGYTFLSGKNCCVNDAYDKNELQAIDPEIHVSKALDKKMGYRTKHVLTVPIIARGKTVGVFLALNKPGGFIAYSVQGVLEFAPLLGLAVEIALLDKALKECKNFESLPFDV